MMEIQDVIRDPFNNERPNISNPIQKNIFETNLGYKQKAECMPILEATSFRGKI